MVGLGVSLLAAGAFPACHKKPVPSAEAPVADVAALKKSYDDLKARLAALETGYTDLRKKIETIPPDLPAFHEVRETFFATEEGRGVMSAKMTILSERLDAVMASKKPEEVQALSKELSETGNSVGQIEQLYVTQMHQIMTFQRVVERQQATKDAAAKAAPPADKVSAKHKGEKAKPAKP